MEYNITIAIASGKGGTGKTSLATSLAYTAVQQKIETQLLDCDVEEPNSALFFPSQSIEKQTISALIPTVDSNKCQACQKCAQFCSFNAIIVGKYAKILDEFCHRCGACSIICPNKAIQEKSTTIGEITIIKEGHFRLITGYLQVGQANPGPVISEVKRHINPSALNIIDAPPGSGCAMMEAVQDSDIVLCVVEDSPFGLHDFQKAFFTLQQMKLPVAVVINRYDIGWGKLESFCIRNKIPILMKIPFLDILQKAYSTGKTLAEVSHSWQQQFSRLLLAISELKEKIL